MAENAQGPRTETGSSALKSLLYKGAYTIVLAAVCGNLIGTAFSTGFDNVFKNARTSTYLEALQTTMVLLVVISATLGTRIGQRWGLVPGALIFCVGLGLLKGQLGSSLRGFICE
ncbi:hypothetical protein FRC12_005881 [Ceratobasidium sp. 428]|nr:hypothetical protein FRC12_005881 [Ceratobasidium sp. 428]